MNSAEARIALNMVPQMGPVRLRKLLEVFGEPERVLAAIAAQSQAGGPPTAPHPILRGPHWQVSTNTVRGRRAG